VIAHDFTLSGAAVCDTFYWVNREVEVCSRAVLKR
jgi:hypothetical protein